MDIAKCTRSTPRSRPNLATRTSVRCFDLATGLEQNRWRTAGRIHSLQFNPRGRRIAIGYMDQPQVSVYDATNGRVLIDGQDIRDIQMRSLRQNIGIVLQDTVLFAATIRENIAFGRPNATEEEVIAAARDAQAHDFIMQTPDGYATRVGERGVTLSGGQKQRVAIARALLTDPRILILDDATSSVDSQTERLIQQALSRLMEDRTTFVIAHRLSTIRRADMILVLDKGKIAARGTHETLLETSPLYQELYEAQLRPQEKNEHSPNAIPLKSTIATQEGA